MCLAAAPVHVLAGCSARTPGLPPRPRAGRLLRRRRDRPARHRRHLLHRARPGAGRHPLLPVRLRGRRAGRRARALAGDGVQERARRPRPRRRQGGDHRRPGGGQDRGPAAGLRPVPRVARRAATSPPATSAPTWRTWTSSARETRFATGRSAAERRRRRLVGPHRVRRVPGHAGRRRAPLGHADAWPAAPWASRASARSGGTWSTTCSRTAPASWSPTSRRQAVDAVRRQHPGSSVVADTDALVAADLDVYSPCALGRALTDEVVAALPARGRLRRRQQPAGPPGHRGAAGRAGHPLRPGLRA